MKRIRHTVRVQPCRNVYSVVYVTLSIRENISPFRPKVLTCTFRNGSRLPFQKLTSTRVHLVKVINGLEMDSIGGDGQESVIIIQWPSQNF